MKPKHCLVALMLLAGCAGRERGGAAAPDEAIASAARPGVAAYTVDQFVHIRRHTAIGFSPDGRSVAYRSDVTGRGQIWTVPSGGGWPRQVTFGEAPVSGAAWAKDGASLAFEPWCGVSSRARPVDTSSSTASTSAKSLLRTSAR